MTSTQKARTRDFCLKYFGFYAERNNESEPILPKFGYPISTVGSNEPLSHEEIEAINAIIREKKLGPLGRLINRVLR